MTSYFKSYENILILSENFFLVCKELIYVFTFEYLCKYKSLKIGLFSFVGCGDL